MTDEQLENGVTSEEPEENTRPGITNTITNDEVEKIIRTDPYRYKFLKERIGGYLETIYPYVTSDSVIMTFTEQTLTQFMDDLIVFINEKLTGSSSTLLNYLTTDEIETILGCSLDFLDDIVKINSISNIDSEIKDVTDGMLVFATDEMRIYRVIIKENGERKYEDGIDVNSRLTKLEKGDKYDVFSDEIDEVDKDGKHIVDENGEHVKKTTSVPATLLANSKVFNTKL